MAYKIFLDINVVMDYIIPDRSEHLSSTQLFSEIENNNLQAYFSESVINTTAYLVHKDISINDFKILMNDLLSCIKVLPCSNAIVEDAYKNAKNDLEDAVLYQIALNGKMDYFITSNIKDFKKIAHPSLPVVTAKKMIDILNS